MTSTLSTFAAHLREFIAASSAASADAAGCSDEVFTRRARELFALQFAHNAPYRRLCQARRVAPEHLEHWSQIPAVPTAAFKDFELTCLSAAERTFVFHSSGTTAQRPSRHFHNAESLAVYEASLWPWFRAHVLADVRLPAAALRVVILSPSPRQAPHSSLAHMFDTVRRQLDAGDRAFLGRVADDGAWVLDVEAAVEALRDAGASDRPLLLLGTAFSFVHLLDGLTARALRFRLPPGSRVMETGGYKGRSRRLPKAELHALIAARLGVPPPRIVCEYGMSELSSQAYDERAGGPPAPAPGAPRAFRFPPWARAQIVSPETGLAAGDGETGLIRVFDLANVFSVLAIQTEDLGVRRADGFELLGRAADAEPRGCSLLAVEA
jgi:hypothetical protein